MSVADTIDRASLSASARALIDVGRIVAARPIVAALARVAPEVVEICELEARLLAREGRTDDALACLRSGRARFGEATLPMLSAELRLLTGDAVGAASDAADAVIADPASAQAKALLGCALGRLGRFDDALACLGEAVRTGPANPTFRQALAEVQERAGDALSAAVTLAASVAVWPASAGLRTAEIMVAMRQRGFEHAVALCEAAQEAGVADACIHGLWGHALSSLGRHEAAGAAYGEARKLAPDDPYVRHLAATSGVMRAEARAPRDYVETVFDGYAERFEDHLLSLGYRVPGLLRAALIELNRTNALGCVLDLGCGTGFMAVALSDFAFERLVGVDLSAAMLVRAAAKGLYTELRQADLQAVLDEAGDAGAGGLWDVVLAADSLSYFGDLDGLLASMAERLRPGGLALFSLERASDANAPPWSLERRGRYVHTVDYVTAACARASLSVLILREEVLRSEGGAPVAGLIVVLQRTPS